MNKITLTVTTASSASTHPQQKPLSHFFNWQKLKTGYACLLLGASFAVMPLTTHADMDAKQANQRWKPAKLYAVGLTEKGDLVYFRTHEPNRSYMLGMLKGFVGADTHLVGMDFRVQDGMLYGVGNGGGIYTIDASARLKLVHNLSQALDPKAKFFGVDFNPAANRLRIISDTGQNLAHNIDDGTTAGTTTVNSVLNDPPPAAAGTVALGVTASAYINNDLSANTATTLFNIDTVRDQISIQSPPAAGTLAATGKLGVDADAAAGFDIFSRQNNGETSENHAFAALQVKGKSNFYGISLLTGKATLIGAFSDQIVDIALPVYQ